MPTCQCSEGCDRKAENESLLHGNRRARKHTYTRIHYPPPEPPSPHSRGCRSEKLNFSDEKVFPAPIPLLPLSPPIHSLIYSLIYELLIYALREKLTVVQSSVRAAATLTIDDHHPRTGMSHTHTLPRTETHMTLYTRSKGKQDRCCISIGTKITVHPFCVGNNKLPFGFNCYS